MGNDYFTSREDIETRNSNKPLKGIGERCFLSKTIVDKNVRIGNDVKIVGGNHLEDGKFENYHVVDGIVIIPKGVVIPDGFQLG